MTRAPSPLFWKTLTLLFLAPTLVAAQDAPSTPENLPSGLDVLKRYAEVTGGAQEYRAVKSLTCEAMLSIPQMNIDGTINMAMTQDGKVNFVVEIDAIGKQEMASDGKHAWALADLTGPRLLAGAEAEQVRGRAELKRFYAPEEVYSKMENRGIEDVQGKPAYRVELTRKSGGSSTEYYDVATGLAVKSTVKAMVHGAGEIEVTTLSSNYKQVGKLKFPFRQVQQLPGGTEQIVEFISYEFNEEIPAARFTPPPEIQKLIDKQAGQPG